MKKILNFICILFLSSCFLFAQNSVSEANRNTAIRCLKLAETCLMGDDWNNALKQAELGLSYDSDISDLIYVKAAAQIHLGKTKAEVLNTIKEAFEKDQWVEYTKNGARILYADLLSDLGCYEESLDVLQKDSFLLSADSEFIRIKNYYRMGTPSSLSDARLKVNTSRRIYPNDRRFPNIFFVFELMYLNEAERTGVEYEIPEIVQTIAESYISKLPDYNGDDLDVELMATFFANDEDRLRLLKAIDAKDTSNNSLMALACMKADVYSDEEAFDMFFESADNNFHLGLLENFALNITDDNVKKQFVDKLLNYDGTIVIDEDYDLQPELTIQYEVGRPANITYDKNNDGVIDMYMTFDFGTPDFVSLNENNVNMYYSSYPAVSKVSFDDEQFAFDFFNDDYKANIVELVTDNVFDKLGLEFYVPSVSKETGILSLEQLAEKANAVELPTTERNNSRVVYKILDGKLVFADFFDNDKNYGYCDFSKGMPFIRYVDQDGDGSFETLETYNLSESEDDFITPEETNFVKSIFNSSAFEDNLYLSKVQIDRNSNTIYEFTEEYLGLGGKITSWDNDDNGIIDVQYIKYPQEPGTSLKEDSIFFDNMGNPYITINFLGGVPLKMNYLDSEVIIYAGDSDNFYWIDEEGGEAAEKTIVDNIIPKLSDGVVSVYQVGEIRVSAIKVNDNIFCKIIPSVQAD